MAPPLTSKGFWHRHRNLVGIPWLMKKKDPAMWNMICYDNTSNAIYNCSIWFIRYDVYLWCNSVVQSWSNHGDMHHLGCIKPCKYWEKLPYPLVFAGFRTNHLTVCFSHIRNGWIPLFSASIGSLDLPKKTGIPFLEPEPPSHHVEVRRSSGWTWEGWIHLKMEPCKRTFQTSKLSFLGSMLVLQGCI